MAKMNIAKHVRPIVQDFVRFWQQQAEGKKRQLADEADEVDDTPLYTDDDDYDDKQKKRQVFEEDLVRFVAWDEGMYALFSINIHVAYWI